MAPVYAPNGHTHACRGWTGEGGLRFDPDLCDCPRLIDGFIKSGGSINATRQMFQDGDLSMGMLSPFDGTSISHLQWWWLDHANDEMKRTVAKMEEYGSADLVALGDMFLRMANQPPRPPVEAMEIGCLIYLVGKINRAIEAVREGRTIQIDTWFDAAVYAKMAQAARSGAWEVGE